MEFLPLGTWRGRRLAAGAVGIVAPIGGVGSDSTFRRVETRPRTPSHHVIPSLNFRHDGHSSLPTGGHSSLPTGGRYSWPPLLCHHLQAYCAPGR